MMKLFMLFINSIFWLWLFIVPAGILSFIGYWIYAKDSSNSTYAVMLAVLGILLGIYLAENVRRKYGLSKFFGRISESPDIVDRNTISEKSED